jgi:hypothetical protein
MPNNLPALGKTKVEIDAPTKGLARDFKRAESLTKKSTDRMTSLFKAAGATIIAVGALNFAKKAISVFETQEQAVRQLNAALESTGYVAGETSRELQDMATHLQSVTTFGDEATIGMQALLLTFKNIKSDVFERTTEAILDLSTAMNQGLKESAIQLGKALNDPVTGISAMTRVGITFSKEQKKMIKFFAETNQMSKAQSVILGELESQFGGSARAMRETFGGKRQALLNTFGDTMELVGGYIAGSFSTSVSGLSDLFENLNERLDASVNKLSNWKNAVAEAVAILPPITNEVYDLSAAIAEESKMADKSIKIHGGVDEALAKLDSGFIDASESIRIYDSAVGDAIGVSGGLEEKLNEAGKAIDDIKKKGDDFSLEDTFVVPKIKDFTGIFAFKNLDNAPEQLRPLNDALTIISNQVDDIGERSIVTFQSMLSFGVQAANSLSSVFAGWATGTIKSFDEVLKSFGSMLAQMVADLIAKYAIFAAISLIFGGGAPIALALGSQSGFSPLNTDRRFSTGNRFSDAGLGGDSGSQQTGFGGSESISPNINVDQPSINVTIDGYQLRTYIQSEDAFDSRNQA